MGWFALPGTIETKLSVSKSSIERDRVKLQAQSFIFEERIRLDRQWEILSISVPSLRLEGFWYMLYTKKLEHLFDADLLAAWNPQMLVSLSVNIKQSGLTIGSVSTNQTLAPVVRRTMRESTEGEYVCEYNTGVFSISDSLQNPITIRGEESLAMDAEISMSVAKQPSFLYEYEEGSGEAKHIVKQQVEVLAEYGEATAYFGNVEEGVGDHTQPGGVVLYINESDKEHVQPPAQLPPIESSGEQQEE
jgi:hypothetical protein